ncbi:MULTISPECIES: MoaD/ThiS family protein [Curtobacterium]|uniref:MoaD/ThiS family protein n=1 Tax=Curtobacterium TaxID=2034 RepID=UPI0015F625CE|nr:MULTISPECIES: MoaD/ThiS family protein [Curtobacterium]MBO9039899.1 MoaD/ThiS family protein [Curtobacterium flaccumfaciens pv. flaccumfaciens]MDT0231981.1 MoaD/ThiS family protein [Curtobacterium sp. BRB10]
MTTIRFFAAARAAVGVDSMTTTADTIDQAVREVVPADPERWTALQERCSYLVDGVTTRDRATALHGVEVVDVMPPFAGG